MTLKTAESATVASGSDGVQARTKNTANKTRHIRKHLLNYDETVDPRESEEPPEFLANCAGFFPVRAAVGSSIEEHWDTPCETEIGLPLSVDML